MPSEPPDPRRDSDKPRDDVPSEPESPEGTPKKPSDEANVIDGLPDLPELPEDTDLQELELDLDPGEPEPIGEIEFDDVDLLVQETEVVHLSTDEPEGTDLPDPLDELAPALNQLHLVEDDLEDFATQEELPILPWTLPVQLLELGEKVTAVLDPTREHSVWERPQPSDEESVEVTVRIRMLDIPAILRIERSETPLLRLGRDVIGGRILIATS